MKSSPGSRLRERREEDFESAKISEVQSAALPAGFVIARRRPRWTVSAAFTFHYADVSAAAPADLINRSLISYRALF